MPLKSELIADARRGPGHGLLRIYGLTPDIDPLEPLSVKIIQNQQGGRYLTSSGGWQAEEVSQILPGLGWDGAVAVVPLGPTLFDPLAQLPNNVRLRMMVTYGAVGPEVSSLSLVQPLPPSFARGEVAASPPPPPPPPPVVIEPDPVSPDPVAAPVEPEPQKVDPPLRADPPELTAPTRDPLPEKKKGSILPLLLVGLLVLLVLAGGAAWKFGLLDGLINGSKPSVTETQAINTREDLARYLGGNPSVTDISGTAKDLTARGKLDLAMLAWQQASRQGSPEAGLALGKMYDPATWSATTSPLPQADAETAAFWYEPAAQGGNVEAQRRLGLVLKTMEPGGSGPQTDKAKEWLKKAADAGDAEAAAALK